MPFTDLTVLNEFATVPFPDDWPHNSRTFFAPIDNLHGVLKTCLAAATESIAIAMYGFDDDELADIVKEKLESEHVAVQLTLDSSQAGGVHERVLLARVDYPNTVVAVGRSERGAIQHQKIAVIDGVLTITGSTNWSDGAETKQDNQMTVTLDRAVAARHRARCDAIHAHMLATVKRTVAGHTHSSGTSQGGDA